MLKGFYMKAVQKEFYIKFIVYVSGIEIISENIEKAISGSLAV